jgi:hypothetical protein
MGIVVHAGTLDHMKPTRTYVLGDLLLASHQADPEAVTRNAGLWVADGPRSFAEVMVDEGGLVISQLAMWHRSDAEPPDG